ncbi:MAG: pantetheine-phosphate adenylyltransferase [Dehalococcoidales bacterium]|jgi:pantetheine-phosphate adenylyltransferase|nr:pantetheine-phosphate adenylyltransferase [Dehalococcoidales bacterium]
MTIAIFPGSFDPITLGHQDVALRAAKVFDKVYFGVYANPNKNVMFSLDERVKFAKATFKDVDNIIVTSYDGLTVDFAKEVGASVMVRGLRVSADFEYEFDMSMMTKKLSPDLNMICFMANPEYQFLSSSLLKEIASLGGDIRPWVPDPVWKAIKKKCPKVK